MSAFTNKETTERLLKNKDVFDRDPPTPDTIGGTDRGEKECWDTTSVFSCIVVDQVTGSDLVGSKMPGSAGVEIIWGIWATKNGGGQHRLEIGRQKPGGARIQSSNR